MPDLMLLELPVPTERPPEAAPRSPSSRELAALLDEGPEAWREEASIELRFDEPAISSRPALVLPLPAELPVRAAAIADDDAVLALEAPSGVALDAAASSSTVDGTPSLDGPPTRAPTPTTFGEERVPTRLVGSPTRRAHDGRYGGYALVRELVRAPGALLAEGRDTIGAPWLLQLVRTRAVADDAERLARQHLEHVVAARTAELLDEPALGLRAHGVVDEVDGTRTLYWVLPWHPRAPRLAADFTPRLGLEAVVRAGVVLARRLVERHARQRTEPLLSASLLVLGEGAPALLGFPVLVPPVAAADGMLSPLLAPEERLHAQPTVSGDLWRLGEVLRRLMEGCGPAGDALTPLVTSLSEPDPRRRPPRASQVLAELESLVATLDGGARTTQLSALDPTSLSALFLAATADSTKVEAARVPSGRATVLLVPDDAAAHAEAPHPAAELGIELRLEAPGEVLEAQVEPSGARAPTTPSGADGPVAVQPTSSQLELEIALGLAASALAEEPVRAPSVFVQTGPRPLPASAASMALAPFAVDLPSDTVCEVATRLRSPDADDALARTVVRARSRPVIERVTGEVQAPSGAPPRGAVLDRTRARSPAPELEAARPVVVGVPVATEPSGEGDADDTQRISVRAVRGARRSAVVVRVEIPREPKRDDDLQETIAAALGSRAYSGLLVVTALVALLLGVVLGVAWPG